MKNKFCYLLLVLALSTPCVSSATVYVPGATLYCNIDAQGGVFFFDVRGAQYEKYGSNYSTNCITPTLEEVKFHCFNVPGAYAVEKIETVGSVNDYLTEKQKFETKSVSICEALPDSKNVWNRFYKTNLPITLRKLEDGSYSATTNKGTFFVFMNREIASK